ncbi:hypothetical protein EB796_024249 [Bugula neritina]|uniref:TTC9C n=1 Tax=Bugula neritina TaxID=10212 RepID=A0A7J7IU41_BUGNE|nr:hypothetical protein EB796_024249 [Bugula neritina]
MESLAVDGFSRGSLEKVEHLLREAKKYKEEGNAWYLSKDYRKAIRCYHQSLLYIKSITQGQDTVGTLLGVNQKESLPADVQQTISKLSRDCHNNLAGCMISAVNFTNT